MKKSSNVIIGPVVIAAMALASLTGCADEYEEVQADNQEICVKKDTDERVADDNCDKDSSHSHFFWWYHSSAYGPAPAVGSRITPGHGTALKPTGSIARPPTSGGFGGSRVSAGT
jgi:hypothetical protein